MAETPFITPCGKSPITIVCLYVVIHVSIISLTALAWRNVLRKKFKMQFSRLLRPVLPAGDRVRQLGRVPVHPGSSRGCSAFFFILFKKDFVAAPSGPLSFDALVERSATAHREVRRRTSSTMLVAIVLHGHDHGVPKPTMACRSRCLLALGMVAEADHAKQRDDDTISTSPAG